MSFVLLDDKFHSNIKTVSVGNDGAGLFARALSYCGDQVTDGFVPLGWAKEVGKPATRRKLTEATFWLEVKGGEEFHYVAEGERYTVTIAGPGYYIPDYLLWNPTRAQVEKKRSEISQKRSRAGKLGAEARWGSKHDGNSDGKDDGKQHGNVIAQVEASLKQMDGPLPQPLKEISKPSTGAKDAAGEGRDSNIGEGVSHALRLLAAMRDGPRHRGSRIREQLCEYAGVVPPAAFENVREQMLAKRSEIRSDGSWALKALQRMARERGDRRAA